MSIFTISSNSFKGQRPGETTVLVTRKHWFALFIPMLFIFLLALLPFIIYSFVSSAQWYSAVASLYWFLGALYFLILWNLAFYNIIIYFLNTVIVTNQRIIQNEQKGFFLHNVDELGLDNIEDISIKIFGPLATFLNFGDIEIQTAGAQNKFYLPQLPNPKKIKQIITDLETKID